MSILEQTIKMKKEGISEEEIVDELSRQGASPREIDDALKQAQIKYAVSNRGNEEPQSSEEVPSPNETYQPRAYGNQQEYAPQQEEYSPMPQETYSPVQEQQYYQPGGYEQYSPGGIDTNTIMEIADQIFSDKIKNVQKLLDATSEAAIILQTKMENVSERVKKIETTIDKLQIAILEKVGSYGRNLEGIKKEMSMMQDSFSKMISRPRREGTEEKKISASKKK